MKFSILKKLLICTPILVTIPAIVMPTIQTTQNNKNVGILPGDRLSYGNSSNKMTNQATSVTYNLVSTTKHGLDCGDDRRYWQYLYWNGATQGSGTSFEQVRWCEQNKLLLRTEGHNKNDRFVYQQIKVNVTVPANVKDYKINFQGEVYEWWDCNYRFLVGSRYQSSVQMFDLGEDANAHPDRFNNYAINKNNVDSRSFMEHGIAKTSAGGMTGTDTYSSRMLSWSFNNETNAPKTFSRYIGVSFWVNGVKDSKNGAVKADIKVGLRTSVDSTGEISHSLQKWGEIRVECRLTNSDSACHIDHYVDGKGILIIPDHVTFCGREYYVREIPSDWSKGENNIKGLKFAPDCRHLKKICASAFKGTNALDYYVEHDNEFLIFPEGLEEIDDSAFEDCYISTSSMKGYAFPSTFKRINGDRIFHNTPTFDSLYFKSKCEFNLWAFWTWPVRSLTHGHDIRCEHIYAPTYELAKAMTDYISARDGVHISLNNEKLHPYGGSSEHEYKDDKMYIYNVFVHCYAKDKNGNYNQISDYLVPDTLQI